MQDQGTDRGTHRCHLYTWDRIPLLDAILGKGQRPEGRFSDKRPKNKPCLAEVFEVKHLSGDGRRRAEHEEAMRDDMRRYSDDNMLRVLRPISTSKREQL